ncbi:MAG TPA: glycoside hydrolase family 20 zincin-like fold domain-containing protein [Bacteroidales bacterium]|nr:glycoside hydrolase family 20 zincin-like fold domain-containing protein [Bacteroidales bacterium]
MNQGRLSLLFVLSLLLATACTREDKATINKAVWSSRDPFNIPYKRRDNEKKTGNLVLNSSFERGRYFNDRLNTFELPGWTEKGNFTRWVDTLRSTEGPDQVSHGSHAIRIDRPRVDEVEEEGAGMLSDFIKVIAGNYRLEYSIRLSQIHPYKERWGSRLEEAVNIRIQYYNKNKIRIGAATINPVNGRGFDNEFKAMPFALFWQIDSLGWMRVRGISNKFPYFDGDIPDEARYIRLFFGLKGPGTMWVDEVRFEFTRHNFTLYERLQNWKDSTFSPYDLLIPRPKQVHPAGAHALFNGKGTSGQPVILIAPDARAVVKEAAEKLRSKINEMAPDPQQTAAPAAIILTDARGQKFQEASLVFSLGENILSRKYRSLLPYDSIPGKSEGYFIYSLEDQPNTVFVAGNRSIGTYYGITTLMQLLDSGKPVYHHARIIDYPDYTRRGAYCSEDLQNLDFLVQHRFNRIYPKISEDQTSPSRSFTRNLGRQSLDGSLFIPGLSLTLYPSGGSEDACSPAIREPEDVRPGSLVLRMDGLFSHPDSCGRHSDEKTPPNGYTGMLEDQIERIRSLVSEFEGRMEIFCLPAWNTSQCMIRSHGKGEILMKELFRRIPSGVDLLWSGPVAYPLRVDASELAYVEKATGEKPVFYCRDMNPFTRKDFLRAYPGKARMSSLFDHFILELPPSLASGYNSGLLTQAAPDSALARVGLQTLSEYLWNARSYNPDLALLKVLISRYGQDVAWELIRLNEAYFGLYEMYGKIRSRETRIKYVRSAEDFKEQVDAIMERLQSDLQGSQLYRELTYYKLQSNHYMDSIKSH